MTDEMSVPKPTIPLSLEEVYDNFGLSIYDDFPDYPIEKVSAPTPTMPRRYPKIGEIFELTLDGDDPKNDPNEMLRRANLDDAMSFWKFCGKRVIGIQTRRFKLVSVNYCQDFNEVLEGLVRHGTIPEGQWCEALRATYLVDYRGPVGIADPSWGLHNSLNPRFPCIDAGDISGFYAGNTSGFCGIYDVLDYYGWRWLVEVRPDAGA